jgi:photosystem II stability/assembly factor-like uncharacterized protein
MSARIALSLGLLLLVSHSGIPPAGPIAEQDSPDAAAAYAAMKRGPNPFPGYERARAQLRRMAHVSVAGERLDMGRLAANAQFPPRSAGAWQALGPGNIGGRTRALLIDPNDPNVMYGAAVSGGVFKTTDGGGQWYPTSDTMANIAVNSLTYDPADPHTLYAGTGEGYYREVVRGTAVVIQGNGIYVSHDGAASWAPLAATANNTDFAYVNDLAVSNHDPHRIYAATRTGVWRSRDAGASWTRVLPTTVQGGCLDLAFRGNTDGDFLFASCGIFQQATVYRSKHGESDDAWQSVLTEPLMGRTSLAISPSNPSIVYALAASNDGSASHNQGLDAVFRSDANGDPGTFTARVRNNDPDKLSTLLLTNAYPAMLDECGRGHDSYTNMGWHCNVIAVDPKDPERVWAAGVDLFRSDDGGKHWRLASYWWPDPAATTSFVHADQHAIVFHPGYDGAANQTLFATNDGGVWRTDNASAPINPNGTAGGACEPSSSLVHFRSLNHGYTATQFYHGAASPDGHDFMGGAQDNSTPYGTEGGGIDGWRMLYGGDGGYVAFDPTNKRRLYSEYQYASMARSEDGGNSWINAYNALNDDFLFITPYALDPNDSNRLWLGGAHVWMSSNRGEIWQTVSTPVDGLISAIAVAPGNPDRVVAGTSTGSIVYSDAATSATNLTTWSSTKPQAGFVSSITFDPANTNVVYATYALFGVKHLWRSEDGGKSWTAIGADLPDIPMHSTAVYGSRLYLGTDLGILVSQDRGATWGADTSFPAVITEALFIGQGTRGPALYAFTHGRGAWRAELVDAARRRIAR